MAAFVLQPHVAEFLDVVMHDGRLEFRLGEVTVPPSSPLLGSTIGAAEIQRRTGALLLALRDGEGRVEPNPDPATQIRAGDMLIAVRTSGQIQALVDAAGPAGT
jgi:voltage-gated potassium channel